jgi:DNA-binding NarL/FixJ family response regulator
MVRVVVVDRRPAVRHGYEAILAGAPGVAPAGSAAGRHDLWPLAYRTDPDVALVADPEGDDGLVLCLRAAVRAPRTRLVLVDDEQDLAVAGAFAKVAAVVPAAVDVPTLLETVRAVAGGESLLPPLTAAARQRAAAHLGPHDRAILAMRLAGTPAREIAAMVGLSPPQLAGRCAAILAALRRRADPADLDEVLPSFVAAPA